MTVSNWPLVVVVLLNYNRAKETVECVHSLEQCGYPSLRLVIVDNGSTDDSGTVLTSLSTAHDVLQTGANLGFAAGNNVGIRHALTFNPGYVLILNNDTIVTHGFLEPLVEAVEVSPGVAASSGTIYYYTDTHRIWYAGGSIVAWRASGFSHHFNERRSVQELGEARSVSFMSGCMMLLRSAVLRTVGGFDERYFMYVEDVELCSRLARAGYRLVYVPTSQIFHKVDTGALRPYALYYMVRNRLLFLSGWQNVFERRVGMAYLRLTLALKSVLWSRKHPELRRSARAAIADYHSGRLHQGRGLSLS